MSERSDVISKKLVIVGDTNSGNTCLLSVFAKGEFPEDCTLTTIASEELAFIEVRTSHPFFGIRALERLVNVELKLRDTCRIEFYNRSHPIPYQEADVVLICFPIDYPASFDNAVHKWLPEVRNFCTKVPIVLVAMKHDLRGCREILENLRERKEDMISHEINDVAKAIKAFDHFECSAKTGQGVRDVFDAAARAALGMKKNKRK